ncbi:MAG: hypothetical protein ACRDN6_06620 [Gaiellaceae bacterium]
MAERVHPLSRRPWPSRVWDAIRGRETAVPVERDAIDESISFPELVWAHHRRQEQIEQGDEPGGTWETEYRSRLRAFKSEHGRIVEAYWCRYEASAVALTEKPLSREDSILRLHTATDWRTAGAPTVASALHDCETLGIRVGEILRGSTEKVALHWLYAATSRLLAFVDKQKEAPLPQRKEIAGLIADHADELKRIDDYYRRAGENSARIVYFDGMRWGALALAGPLAFLAAVGWIFDGFGVFDLHEARVQNLFVCLTMGAIGAIVSVMTRMADVRSSFSLEFEVGRKPVRRLGALRPFIGATFALALYLALKSDLLQIGEGKLTQSPYFYATISFLAGFSERRAKILLEGAAGGAGLPSESKTA